MTFRRGLSEYSHRYRPSYRAQMIAALKDAEGPLSYEDLYRRTGMTGFAVRSTHLDLVIEGVLAAERDLRLSGYSHCPECGSYERQEEDDYLCPRCRHQES